MSYEYSIGFAPQTELLAKFLPVHLRLNFFFILYNAEDNLFSSCFGNVILYTDMLLRCLSLVTGDRKMYR